MIQLSEFTFQKLLMWIGLHKKGCYISSLEKSAEFKDKDKAFNTQGQTCY